MSLFDGMKKRRRAKVLKEMKAELSKFQSENALEDNRVKKREKDITDAETEFLRKKKEWEEEIKKAKKSIRENLKQIAKIQSSIATLEREIPGGKK